MTRGDVDARAGQDRHAMDAEDWDDRDRTAGDVWGITPNMFSMPV